jgi:urea transporter
VPELEAMMVMGLRRITQCIATSNPEIGQKTLVQILVADCTEERAHVCQSAAVCAMIIKIMRIHQLRAKIKAFQRHIVLIRKEELMSIPDCKAERIVIIFVISGTNQTAAYLTALSDTREGSLI